MNMKIIQKNAIESANNNLSWNPISCSSESDIVRTTNKNSIKVTFKRNKKINTKEKIKNILNKISGNNMGKILRHSDRATPMALAFVRCHNQDRDRQIATLIKSN